MLRKWRLQLHGGFFLFFFLFFSLCSDLYLSPTCPQLCPLRLVLLCLVSLHGLQGCSNWLKVTGHSFSHILLYLWWNLWLNSWAESIQSSQMFSVMHTSAQISPKLMHSLWTLSLCSQHNAVSLPDSNLQTSYK